MLSIEELEAIRKSHDNCMSVPVGALINSHIEANQRVVTLARATGDEIPRLPDVVYLAWPNPEKAQFERKSRPSENPALGVAVFVTELEALRFANDADVNYRVTCAPFGMTINQAKYNKDALLDDGADTEKKEPF